MLIDLVRLIAALAAFVLVGRVCLAAVLGRRSGLGLALDLSLSFALGLGAIALTLFLTSIAGLRWSWPWLLLAPWLLLLWPIVRAGRSPADVDAPPAAVPSLDRVRGGLELSVLLLLVIAVNVITVAWLALDKPVWNYDALTRWMFKAKAFFADRSVLPYFHDLERGVTQPHYPPLVSLCGAWIYLALGHEDDRLVKALFASVFVALLLGAYGLARRQTSRVAALIGTLVLSAVPCLVYLDFPSGVGAASALADVPLALVTLLCIGALGEWWHGANDRHLLLAGLFGGLGGWVKQEGVLLLVFVGAAAVLRAIVRRPRVGGRTIGLALGAAALLYAPWYLYQRGVPITDDVYYPAAFTIERLIANLPRVPVIAARYAQEFSAWREWNALWPLAAIALLLAPRAAVRNGALFVFTVLAGHLLAYAAVYLLDDFLGRGAYEQKMEITITRLFIHVAPLAALVIALQTERIAAAALPRASAD